MSDKLPIGTKVRFLRTLTCAATEDHPAFLFALAGEKGEITGHDCEEGYWVKTAVNPPFGAERCEFEPIDAMSESKTKVAWKGIGRNCQSGLPHVCLAASFDGVVCGEGECDIGSGNRKKPAKEEAKDGKPKREPRPNRTRKARWRGTLGGVWFLFEYSPSEGVIRVWRHRHHKKRIITMTDLLHALDGQKLLPL